MGACVKCGNKGLFLWLDKSGYCMKCAKEIIAEQEKAQNEAILIQAKNEDDIYQEAVRLYAQLPENKYCIDSDMMPHIDEYLNAYDNLIEFLNNKCRNDAYLKKYKERGTYESNLYWANREIGGLLFHNVTPSEYIDKQISSLRSDRYKFVEARTATQDFERRLFNLMRVDIAIESAASPINPDELDYPEFTAKTITSRTPKGSVCDYVVVDVETTGLRPRSNEIIQLCAIKYENFIPVGAYCTYVKPRKRLNPKAQEINKITWDHVKDAPYIEQVIKDFDAFIGPKTPIVGHNVVFDCQFLYASGSQAITPKRKYYDTCALAKKIYDLDSYSLSNICESEYHIIRTTSHDALSDSFFCGMLFANVCYKIIT